MILNCESDIMNKTPNVEARRDVLKTKRYILIIWQWWMFADWWKWENPPPNNWGIEQKNRSQCGDNKILKKNVEDRKNHRLGEKVLFWMLFTNRLKYVIINNIASNTREVQSGVPQSSVLVLLLFLI